MNPVDALQAILFISDGPAKLEDLALRIGLTEGQTEQALELLTARLDQVGSIQLNKISGGYHLSTKPEYAEVIETYLRPQPKRLSKNLLETLAIIAYKQPITVSEIEEIRGVQSDYAVRTLFERRLIDEVGRKPTPGRPVLYSTTENFLHQFKLNALTDLPDLQTALPFND